MKMTWIVLLVLSCSLAHAADLASAKQALMAAKGLGEPAQWQTLLDAANAQQGGQKLFVEAFVEKSLQVKRPRSAHELMTQLLKDAVATKLFKTIGLGNQVANHTHKAGAGAWEEGAVDFVRDAMGRCSDCTNFLGYCAQVAAEKLGEPIKNDIKFHLVAVATYEGDGSNLLLKNHASVGLLEGIEMAGYIGVSELGPDYKCPPLRTAVFYVLRYDPAARSLERFVAPRAPKNAKGENLQLPSTNEESSPTGRKRMLDSFSKLFKETLQRKMDGDATAAMQFDQIKQRLNSMHAVHNINNTREAIRLTSATRVWDLWGSLGRGQVDANLDGSLNAREWAQKYMRGQLGIDSGPGSFANQLGQFTIDYRQNCYILDHADPPKNGKVTYPFFNVINPPKD